MTRPARLLRRAVAVAAACGTGALLASCGTVTAGSPASPAVTVWVTPSTTPTATAASSTAAAPTVTVTAVTTRTAAVGNAPEDTASDETPRIAADDFEGSFAKLRRSLSGPASVAVIDYTGKVFTAGDHPVDVAWSTSKVPVALAALARSTSAATQADVRAAIRDSDNASAQRLWDGLPNPPVDTEAVLRAAHDDTTKVPTRRLRAGFTVFGQTRWSVADSARFAGQLGQLPHGETVLAHMTSVSGSQQWGFWHLSDAAVKGGWGPVGNGYLVRQLGVVRGAGVGSARVPVPVAAMVSAPTFEAGKKDLTAIARWSEQYVEIAGG